MKLVRIVNLWPPFAEKGPIIGVVKLLLDSEILDVLKLTSDVTETLDLDSEMEG
jgi:hypothetical protein